MVTAVERGIYLGRALGPTRRAGPSPAWGRTRCDGDGARRPGRALTPCCGEAAPSVAARGGYYGVKAMAMNARGLAVMRRSWMTPTSIRS